MNYKKRAQQLKENYREYFIQNLSIVHDGKIFPVITTVQAHCQWAEEYGRAEFYKRWVVIETIMITLIVLINLLK